ncbi:MAG: hypothetical protein ACXVWZ_08790 [Nocardioides sp.]
MTIDEIIARINGFLDKVQAKLEELTDKVNSILSHVPGFLSWAVDKFMDLWNTMLDKLGEFWGWFTDKLAYAGDPFGLGDVGDRWNSDLGLPAKALADSIDDEHELLVDDTWTGLAATAYKEQVPDQESALRTVGQTFASAVDSAMGTLKAGIITFWAAVVTALVTLVLAIIAATAAAGTVIGLPAAPVAVISGIVAFLLAAGTGVAALYLTTSSAADSFRNARQYATSWPDFAVG